MPLYDCRCNKCRNEFEYMGPSHTAPGPCIKCNSDDTRIIWKTVPILDKAKDPYDYLDGPIPDSKPIKSFANDRRKGGKDR